YKLTKFYDTDIYLFVNYQRGSFIYNLVNNRSWPPKDKDLRKALRVIYLNSLGILPLDRSIFDY
ncbi:hypothetical protein N7475_005068, partial [Penicillium sp. IBT 31633x]